MNLHVLLTTPLFAFKTDSGSYAPMCRALFLNHCNDIWTAEHFDSLNGHAFWMGGMTHILLVGVDPLIIMVQGQWCSSAFLEYWWHCEKILPSMISISLHFQTSIISTMSPFKQSLLGTCLWFPMLKLIDGSNVGAPHRCLSKSLLRYENICSAGGKQLLPCLCITCGFCNKVGLWNVWILLSE